MADPRAKQIPMVGVGAIIVRKFDGVTKILAGERTKTHGNGCLSFPGGHLEHGETWRQCACRETEEETTMIIECADSSMPFEVSDDNTFVTNNLMDGDHYITVWTRAEWKSGEAIVNDGKHKSWDWYTFQELIDAVEKSNVPWQDHWIPVALLQAIAKQWGL